MGELPEIMVVNGGRRVFRVQWQLSDECALAKFAERAQKRLHDKAVTPSELYGTGRDAMIDGRLVVVVLWTDCMGPAWIVYVVDHRN